MMIFPTTIIATLALVFAQQSLAAPVEANLGPGLSDLHCDLSEGSPRLADYGFLLRHRGDMLKPLLANKWKMKPSLYADGCQQLDDSDDQTVAVNVCGQGVYSMRDVGFALRAIYDNCKGFVGDDVRVGGHVGVRGHEAGMEMGRVYVFHHDDATRQRVKDMVVYEL